MNKVTVQADRERLGLAIDAVLENAVRHTAKDDVIRLSVTASGAGPLVPGPDVRVTVADDGSGIPAELLPHVFDRFRVGDGPNPRGTGLGLPLVRAVARAHGGEVLVRTWPGQGSSFELVIPLHGDGTEPSGTSTLESDAGTEGKAAHAGANLEGSI